MSDKQVRLKMNAATDAYLALSVDDGTTEDAVERFILNADGKLEFGNGTDAVDTNLYRSAADTLKTDDALVVASTLAVTGAATLSSTASVTGVLTALAGLSFGDYKLDIEEVAFGATELGGSETNTSFTFTAGTILLYAFINVADAESGTMDVGTQGTSNDPDGILDGIDLTNTGVIMPGITVTGGLNIDFIGAATTVGALWYKKAVGTDSVADAGYAFWLPQVITAADPVSITSSGDLNSCSGSLYLVMLVPTA
jgi:hypothetical protein